MSNVLFELGCEEIPARFMPGLLDDLKQKAAEKLAGERLTFSKVETLGTSRRLVLYIEDLSAKQPDQTDEMRGPSAEIAFDASGKPTQAALGFAKAQKVPVEKLTVRTVNNRNYVFANVVRKGKPTEAVLPTLLPEIISSLHLPLAMRWGDLDFKFIRPIHSILALYGKKTIKFQLAGIKSGNKTFAHRYSLPVTRYSLPSANLVLYNKILLKLGVIVDHDERKELAKKRIAAAAKKIGARPLLDPALLAEVAFLVEEPAVYIGKFNTEFLKIPNEVLVTSMKKHQKYFPLLDSDGKLLARFAVVTDGCANAKVIEGNEQVLSARLSDARFFFEEDKKIPLARRVPDLARVAFFEKLGTIAEKIVRMNKLSSELGEQLKLSSEEIKTVHRIVELCKADLTTKMVFEFPELQGIMGKEYAKLAGEEPKVAEGIMEHYLPRFADDALPRTREGVVVALADRFDSLVGAFAVGSVPTGSEDPYGLRRAAHGIIRIILEKKLDLLLDETIDQALKLFHNAPVKKEILAFFIGRLRPLLQEKGIRYDIADAALHNFNDILDVFEKAAALNALVNEPWLAGVIASADRLSRIAGGSLHDQPREHDLVEPEEKYLYELALKANWQVNERVKKEDWAGAAKELAQLTDPIEKFFAKVLVMHQDERLKSNRLALLKSLDNLYLTVADFRQIVIEGQSNREAA